MNKYRMVHYVGNGIYHEVYLADEVDAERAKDKEEIERLKNGQTGDFAIACLKSEIVRLRKALEKIIDTEDNEIQIVIVNRE
jgi:hypothetical protein